MSTAPTKAELFRAMHHGPDPLILPNAWDPVSARVMAEAGYPAIATSSAAVARVIGYDDGQQTPPAEMFGAIARIARAVDVPVTADMEAGYGHRIREESRPRRPRDPVANGDWAGQQSN